MQERLQNINVVSSELLPTPEAIKRDLPLTQAAEDFVFRSRQAVRRILDRDDPRLAWGDDAYLRDRSRRRAALQAIHQGVVR